MVRAAVCGTEGRQFESVPVYQKMNKEKKLQASLPKGFKDRWGEELNLKNQLVDTIKDVFINFFFRASSFPHLSLNPFARLGINLFCFSIFWYTRADSNCRPSVPQTAALTN